MNSHTALFSDVICVCVYTHIVTYICMYIDIYTVWIYTHRHGVFERHLVVPITPSLCSYTIHYLGTNIVTNIASDL